MAKNSNAFVSLDVAPTVADVAPIVAPVTKIDGLPKVKKLPLAAIKAHFNDNFKRASLSEQRKASKDKNDASLMLVATYVGYALHKAHSGMGENEPGMSDARAQIVYAKDGKKTTVATMHFEAAFGVLRDVANKGMAESTMPDFESFKVTIEALFTGALITSPQALKDSQKAKREADKSTSEAGEAGETGEAGEAGELPTELVDIAVANIISTLDALSMAQLLTLQAAIAKAIDAQPPF